MNLLSTKIILRFCCFILFGLTVIIGCTKDGDETNDEIYETTTEKTNATAVNNPVEAVISGSVPSNAKAPAKIDFKAWNSKNQTQITSFSWDFKDGSTTTTKNPSHTFTKAGTYAVKLTVKNKAGFSHSTSRTITITGSSSDSSSSSSSASSEINVAAVISGSVPSSAQAPATIGFKAWNSVNQKEIKGYFWDFKDGSTTTTKNPSHTFLEPGDYAVELSVRNAAGETHSTTRNIKITGSSSGGSNSGSSGSSGSGSSGGSDSGGSGSGSGSNNSGNYPSNAVFASSFGFKSGDATSAFEAAIKSGSSYVVIDRQSSDWVIRPTRFFNLRNMTIVFESGVTLRAKPGAFSEGKRLFEMVGASNVTVEGRGATFKMNRNEYTSGQQRHAFSINNCDGITVRGLTIRDSGGAGIMIYGGGGSGYSRNITVENVRSLNNKRDGITVVSAENVWVRNSEFSGSNGSRPEAGVVLEPDNPNERLVNINFSNCKFAGNNGSGVHFGVYGQNSGSRPVSVKIVDSEFSNNALSVPSGKSASEVVIGGGRGAPLGGEVRFERAKFNGVRGRVYFSRKSGDGFKVVFKDCEARNVVTGIDGSPIVIEAENTRNSFGGVEFDNFYIQYDRNVPFLAIKAPKEFNGTINRLKNVKANFTVKEPYDNPVKYHWGYRNNTNVNVSLNHKHI